MTYHAIGPWSADEARRLARYIVRLTASAYGAHADSHEEAVQAGQAVAHSAMRDPDGRLLDKLPGLAAFGVGMTVSGMVANAYHTAPSECGPVDRVRWAINETRKQRTIYDDPSVVILQDNLIQACDDLLREASDTTDWKTSRS